MIRTLTWKMPGGDRHTVRGTYPAVSELFTALAGAGVQEMEISSPEAVRSPADAECGETRWTH